MILKGFDTLEFGLKVENYESSLRPYLDLFQELKVEAQETGIEQTLLLNNVTLTVHRTGKRFYPFRVSCDDFVVFFADKELNMNPPIFVRFSSGYIWSFGLAGAYKHFTEWLQLLTDSSYRNQISRVDICVDSDSVTFRQIDSKGVTTRARKKEECFVSGEYTNGRKFSGFRVGIGGPLLARIYNKTMEIQKSGKDWFKQIWREHGWNEDKDVWRVEFQLRREVLKEFSIHTIEELLEKENNLWAYLTHEWLTIRQQSSDNVSRWKIKRKWTAIQKADMKYEASPLIREKVKQGSLEQLLNQGRGILLSVAAIGNHNSIEDTTKLFQSWTEIGLNKKNTSFHEEKERRRKKYLFND
ncbi:replication initiation factor [Brevibacillus choshinensis]|uniref:replication initiation factor n=1 Tax=Brevibacillus choshinensis TaxID=54911 RepID=UPI002E201556|nr:replication initiation factor [Brevibacillus choshinensis]